LIKHPGGFFGVDCGPQIPEVLRLAGLDLNSISWFLTHVHPDHDSGFFDLLSDSNVTRINIFTSIFGAISILEKAKILGLEQQAREKIPFLHNGFSPDAFIASPFNADPDIPDKHASGLRFDTEWTLHGIPTLMVRAGSPSGKSHITYTADGALSDDRIAELEADHVLTQKRKARISSFISSGPGSCLMIEEVGRGGNHSTRPSAFGNSAEKRFVHWAKCEDLPPHQVAQTFEIIDLE
jgi:ribonuclease BN (tRNA processing enzyme)